MSYLNSTSFCVTCKARNKECDGTRGPSGCQRCAQARISCGGYPDSNSRIPRLEHSVRENQPQTSPTYYGYSENSIEIPNSTSRSVKNGVLVSTTHYREYPAPRQDPSYPSLSHMHAQHYTTPSGYTPTLVEHFPSILASQTTPLANQALTPPIEGTIQPCSGRQLVIPSQASLTNSMCHFAESEPIALESPESRREQVSDTVQGDGCVSLWSSSPQSQTEPTVKWPASYLDSEPEPEDTENIEEGLLNELALDRQVESNTLPFVAHCFAAWMTSFTFDPLQILPSLINHIRRGYSFGDKSRQIMLLISNSVLAISKSTDYDLTHFNTLNKLLEDRVVDARARDDAELTRELALGAMEHSHQVVKLQRFLSKELKLTDEKFLSTLFKVGSLANVLNVMQLYAPIFRRACPESSEELVNLPRRLMAMEIQMKYYAALDVLLSLITHRPMFFRYNLEFISPREEMFIKSGNGPGLRWLYGVPDRLMITLARINTLFEDFGNRVDLETVLELEKEIAACETIVHTSAKFDPTLNIGRMVVQEAWRLVAKLYLYMALCGADSSDGRVTKLQKQFMNLLRGVKPRRNPDSFLILPIVVLAVATTSPTGQSILLARLWGVSECRRPETVGNDVLRMMNDIWARTTERPAVWSDLRTACLRVTGM